MGGPIERERELAAIDRVVEAAAAGAGGALLVEGPAGIGKTTLLEHARRCGQEAGMRVLWGSGGELERDVSFGIVRQLLERPVLERGLDSALLTGAAGIAAPVFGLAPSAPSGDGGAVLHGLHWVFANLAEERPLVVCVDDAHLGDGESLRALAYLARRVADLPVALVIARRAGEHAPEALRVMVAEGSVARLDVGPLSEEAVAAMIGSRLGRDPDPEFTRACREATGGNPFFLDELLGALGEDGTLPTAAAAARVERLTPEAVRITVGARLGRLPDPARGLARALAVTHRGEGLGLAAELAGLTEAAAAEAAGALERAGFVAGEPPQLAHPILREAILADMPVSERSHLHRRAAALLAARDAEPELLAPHLLAVEPAGDAEVVATLRAAAAASLERGAPEAAAAYLERGLREPPADEGRIEVLAELGGAESVAGIPAAIEHLEAAARAAPDAESRTALTRDVARGYLELGRPEEGVAVLRALLEEDPAGDSGSRTAVEADAAIAIGLGVPHERPSLLAELEARAPGLGSSPPERTLLAVLSFLRSTAAGSTAGAAFEAAARAIGEDGEALAALGPAAHGFAVMSFVIAERPDLAEPEVRRALEGARAAGSSFGLSAHSFVASASAARRGALREAESFAVEGLEALRLSGNPMGLASLVSVQVDVLTRMGRIDDAEAALRAAGLDGAAPAVYTNTWILEMRGLQRLAAGRSEEARDDLLEAGRQAQAWDVGNPAASHWRASAALAHLALGEREEARRLALEGLELARGFGAPGAIGIAARTLGRVEGGERGIELLREAVACLEASPWALELAEARIELGAALRRAGTRSEAREVLAAGLDGAARAGARPLAERAREELRAAGARPRRELLSGIDALTARERSVAVLAAEGRSNPQIAQALFVTRKTVEKHLGNVYRKLEIESRDELAAALADASPD